MTPDVPAGATPGPEPCRGCRAPLVPGQRYCLYCGTRVSDARLEFLDVLAADVRSSGGVPAPAPVLAVPPPPEPGVNGWLRSHSPLLGLTGLLLLTLLIGLLIGHWATSGDDGSSQAAAPQVIRVSGGGGTATTTADDAGATDDAAAADSSDASTKKASKKADDADTAAPPKDAVSVDKLNTLTGKAKDKAIEQAAKKGQPITTGSGKAPPKDDKAPGGGSDFETIG